MGSGSDGALTIPFIHGELTTPEQLHNALLPAWDSLVENRNSAGLVGPKEEGKPQPPLSKEETAYQFDRVQRGKVDSARLLLVFGMVPSASHIDNHTLEAFMNEKRMGEDPTKQATSTNLPAVVNPELRYPDGSTPLHMAATFGLERSVQSLLDARAEINAFTSSGVQPIHAAAIMGHVSVVDVLSSRGADVDARHGFASSTPLHFATEMGHHKVVERLCELGADVEAEKTQGGTPIHISADTNNAQVARSLIDRCGADPDAVLLGDTVPLYLAAGRGFPDVIDVLLDAGANPDRTLWPHRPWHKKSKRRKGDKASQASAGALQANQGDPSQFLPGSHPDAPGFEQGNGATALHNACENGHLSAAQALLDGGARQLATMEGVTPLITSLQYRHRQIASALLDHRTPANVGVTNPGDGQSALHVASAYDYPEVVARILRDGGDTLQKDRRGNIPLDYVRGRECQSLLVRFHGRAPRLDSVVRSNRDGDLVQLLTDAEDVDSAIKRTYVKYAKQHIDGTLEARAQRLAEELKKGKEPGAASDRNRKLQQFAIARFLLAGGDVPVAVESMMQRTEAGMHVGLVLLGVSVKSLEYVPTKSVKVNGHEVVSQVNNVVQAAMQRVQTDENRLESVIAVLRSAAEGRIAGKGQRESTSSSDGSLATNKAETPSPTQEVDEEGQEGDVGDDEDALEL